MLSAVDLTRDDVPSSTVEQLRRDVEQARAGGMSPRLAELLGRQIFLTGRPTRGRDDLQNAGLTAQQYRDELDRIQLDEAIQSEREALGDDLSPADFADQLRQTGDETPAGLADTVPRTYP